MSTVFSSWQKLLSMSPVVGTRISLDLGSSNTRIMVGDKLVYHQPSCLLWHPASETVADIGTKALQAVDKLPPAVQVLFPVRSGEITDTKVAELYLKSVLTKVLARPKAWPIIIGLRSMIGVPAGQTPVEKNILKTVLANVGLGSSTYFSKTQAINTVLLRQAHIRDHVCIIDIGGQTTEIGIFFGSECVASTTILIGGNTYTQEILAVLKEEAHCLIGWFTAEKIKHQYRGNLISTPASTKTEEYKTIVRGKDMLTGVPLTVSLSSSHLRKRFALVTEELQAEVKNFFGQIPPELLTATMEESVYFTGGGSLLSGVVELITHDLKCHFSLSKDPLEDVARGLSLSQ